MFQLLYWPMLPGRGEFVRLVLEDSSEEYQDLARTAEEKEAGSGVALVRSYLYGSGEGQSAFAPPFLFHKDRVLAQTAAVCSYLADELGLAPTDSWSRTRALQLFLCICEVVDAVHDTHHPIASSFFEDQIPEAINAAALFRTERLPVWLAFFEKTLEQQGDAFLVAHRHSYADLGLYQLVRGLWYAFPSCMTQLMEKFPQVTALVQRVEDRSTISSYRASKRAMAFNNDGIFRAYSELDAPKQ